MPDSCGIVDRLRGPKVFDMSIFDWIGSMFLALLIGYIVLGNTYRKSAYAWIGWIVVWIMLGVFVHFVVGVPTMFGYYLGLNPKPQRKQC